MADDKGTPQQTTGAPEPSPAPAPAPAPEPEPTVPVQPEDPKEEAQLIRAEMAKHGTVKEGETWHLVSTRWWRSWKQYTGYEDSTAYRAWSFSSASALTAPTKPSRPPAIDNASLVEDDKLVAGGTVVKTSCLEYTDYELVPDSVWRLIHAWYGGGPDIARRGILSTTSYGYAATTASLEVRPLGITAFRSSAKEKQETFRVSKVTTVGDFKKAACERFGIADLSSVRLWDYHGNRQYKLLDAETKTLESCQIIEGNPILLEEKDADGKFPAVAAAAPYASSAAQYSSFYGSSSAYGGSSYYSAPMEAPGLCGLSNQGNTCFMNSALQCLSNTEPLVAYLLSGQWKRELNVRNPLGTHGELTTEYAKLVREIWRGSSGVICPRDFKWKLGRFAPQFEGYQQHDSQELLAFLLDGLHEDLNRVLTKPYVEVPDYAGQPDAQWADESWQRHLARNNSVIVDLFQGQLKSTVVCPVCSAVSVTFDPFMYLSLPFPQSQTRSVEVVYHPRDPKVKPTAADVTFRNTVSDLRRAIAEKFNAPAGSEFLLADIYSGRFYARYGEKQETDEITGRETVHAYELLPASAAISRVGVLLGKKERMQYSNWVDEVNFGVPMVLHVPRSASYNDLCLQVLRGMQRFIDPAALAEVVDEIIRNRKAELQAKGNTAVTEEEEMGQARAAKQFANAGASSGANVEVIEMEEEGPPTRHAPYSELSSTDSYSSTDSIPDSPPGRDVSMSDDEPAGAAGVAAADAEQDDAATESKTKVPRVEEPEGEAVAEADEDNGEATVFPGIPDSKLVRAMSGLIKVYACDQYGKSSYLDRSKELVIGDGTTPLNIADNALVCAMWTSALSRVYIPENEVIGGGAYRSRAGQDDGKPVTLDACLELFTQAEQLGPDDLWRCPKCKDFRQATKKFDLWKLPPILVIHLKRFSFKSKYWRDKLDTMVDFPIEGLDMSQRTLQALSQLQQSQSQAPLVYDLFAISNHYGSLGGGHYTAFAKNKDSGQWHKFDDSHVSPVSNPESTKTTAAYMLFYRLRGFQTPTYEQVPDTEAAPQAAQAVPAPREYTPVASMSALAGRNYNDEFDNAADD